MSNSLDLSPIPETLYGHRNRARFILGEISRHQILLGRTVDVLDVGCGTGDLITVWVAQLRASVLGIDVHRSSIELARVRHVLPNLQFSVGVAEELLESGQTFDVIICAEVLEHLDEPLNLLSTLRKLIRPNGILIVTIPNGWGPKENEERIVKGLHVVKTLFHPLFGFRHSNNGQFAPPINNTEISDTLNKECGHVQFFTMTAINKLAYQSGFSIEKQENRRFLSGPISNMLFGRYQRFIEWNVRVARVIPYWLASSWMFVFHPRLEESKPIL